jgi:serine/threonine-protein kinase
MGQVYLALSAGPAGVQKLLVVKQLRDDLASLPEARNMFLDEARIAALLQHPNIVQTYEVVDEADDLYIVMEFLDGRSLSRMMAEGQRSAFTLPMRLRILAETLAALHYAHTLVDYEGKPLGIVHRDVSPQNVFVTYDGHVKLVDFGIAKAANATSVTQSGVFKGKVRHAAPEQLLAHPVDGRADVFSVGTLLWEALTDQRMWGGMGDATVLFELAAGKIPRASDARPDVPAALEAICRKALAHDPAERFADANEMRHALLDYLHSIDDETTSAEIAAAMNEVFTEQRRVMQSRIEGQIRTLREHPSEVSLPRISLDSLGLATATPVLVATRSDAPVERTVFPPPSPPPRSRASMASILFAVGGAFTLAAAVALRTTAAIPSPSAVAGAAPLLHEQVHVHLHALPPGARFALDGAELSKNPFDGDVPRDTATHLLSITSPGFAARMVDVHFDRDVDVEVALERAGVPAREPGHEAVAPPARPVWRGAPATAVAKADAGGPRRIDEDDPYSTSDNPYGGSPASP